MDHSWQEICPVCREGKLIGKKHRRILGLVTSLSYECDVCGAVFIQEGDKIKLMEVLDETSEIWLLYGKKSLYSDEWKRIALGKMKKNDDV